VQWHKSPPTLVDRFGEIVPDDPRVERRLMFGYPAAFVGGNMFMGLHQENLVVRLAQDARAELLAVKGASTFEPMAGRPMREYVVVPAKVYDDDDAMRRWASRALAYGASLPAKGAKGAKTAKPKRGPSPKATKGTTAKLGARKTASR
jgi:TfoX/Sxy family transcriptional regulator of competence genes